MKLIETIYSTNVKEKLISSGFVVGEGSGGLLPIGILKVGYFYASNEKEAYTSNLGLLTGSLTA